MFCNGVCLMQDEVEALLRRGAYGTLADEDEANEAAKYVLTVIGASASQFWRIFCLMINIFVFSLSFSLSCRPLLTICWYLLMRCVRFLCTTTFWLADGSVRLTLTRCSRVEVASFRLETLLMKMAKAKLACLHSISPRQAFKQRMVMVI